MVVTHLFQVLGFVAMEPPVSLDAASRRREGRRSSSRSAPLDPARVVRASTRLPRGGRRGARLETETFVALEVFVDDSLGGRAVLPAHRQVACGEAAAPSPSSSASRLARSSLEPRSPTRRTLLTSTSASRARSPPASSPAPGATMGSATRASSSATRVVRTSKQTGGLRAAGPRRHARRPDAVHPAPTDRAALGGREPALRERAAAQATSRLVGAGGRTTVAPRPWHVPTTP